MKTFSKILLLTTILLFVSGCASGPPKGGNQITLSEGITLKLNPPWEAEIDSSDWSTWTRQQKGRVDENWIIPPITVTKNAPGGDLDRTVTYRFKGLKGEFDPTINPETSNYPIPPGLWHLNPKMLELQSSAVSILEWPSIAGAEATVRLYENTHGEGAGATLRHTYTVTFNRNGNAYEFVMSIPDTMNTEKMIDDFWASIIDLEITLQ